MSGPTTPASASPEVTPKTPMATAIASSKLLPAAVKAIEACAVARLAVQQQVDLSAGTVSSSHAAGSSDQRLASSSSAYDIVGASPLTK